ncbi:MAG: tetratricopeptide repeat protein [Terriglobales bacterium]
MQPSTGELEDAQSVRQFLHKNGVAETLVCTVTALAYLGTLAFGFVYDDKPAIVDNIGIRSWGSLSHYFVRQLSTANGTPGGGTFYRPIAFLWLRLNYACFGLNPAGWHFAMLAGHVLMTYLVFAVVKKLTNHCTTAMIAGLLFGLHPVHVENVAWLSSVGDLLMSVLLLGSFLAYLKFRDRGKTKIWLGISLLLFALALLSKETAAVFPLLILAFSITSISPLTFQKASLKSVLSEAWVSIPYFIILAGYLAIRLPMLHGVASPTTPLPWTTMLFTWPSAVWFDVNHLLLPLSSSEFYSLAYVTKPGLASFLLPVLFVVVALMTASFGILRLSNPSLGFFALIWAALPILPTLYLRAVAPDNFVHDRFLYLPSVGIVLLLALAIEQLSIPRTPRSSVEAMPTLGIVKWTVVALLAAVAFVATSTYQLQWANNILLYSDGIKSAPQNLIVKDNLANELSDLGDYESAIALYLSVLQQNPRFWSSNYNLGYTYYRLGRFAEAEGYLTRAIRIDNRDPDEFIFLARAQMQQGKLAQASQNADLALEKAPLSPGFHFVRAKILEARGLEKLAIAEYQAEVMYHPENAVARSELRRARSLP